jgi:hypothetical protein
MFVYSFSLLFRAFSLSFHRITTKNMSYRLGEGVVSGETISQRRKCSHLSVILVIRDVSYSSRIPFFTRPKTRKLFFRKKLF